MKPLVSVLIPIYGVESYIEECAISVFNQTYDNLEIIFINDCTKDNSILILQDCIKTYAKNYHIIKIINHKENGGVAAARQTGLDASTGDYIIQFDSDDYVESNIIELLVKKVMEEEADIVICDYDNVYENNSLPMHVNPPLTNIELICKLFTGEVHSSLCNKLIKKELYKLHDINFTVGLNMCEDLSVMYRLVYFSRKISYIPKVLYHYRQNVANSFSSQKMPLRYQLNLIDLLVQINNFLKCNYGQENSKLRRYFKYLVLGKKGSMLLYGDINNLNLFENSDMKFSYIDIITHPNLHRNFKLILILNKIGSRTLVRFVRNLQKNYHKYCR